MSRKVTSSLELERLRRLLRPEQPEGWEQAFTDALRQPSFRQQLAPVFEELLRQRPQLVIDVLVPVMGPIIRKSVRLALRSTVEKLNRALEASFSPRGLAWRFSAWRTGRTFAEVALVHSLVFRVEQVFLIHRETGLLLQEVVAPGAGARDADMVSGMLIAIRDFILDSFSEVGEGEGAEALGFGDVSVWVEQSDSFVLAAVIRGEAPVRIREQLRKVSEEISRGYPKVIADYDGGDVSEFEPMQPLLAACLQESLRDQGKPWFAIVFVVLAVTIPLYFWVTHTAPKPPPDRAGYVRAILDAHPGVVVTKSREQDGHVQVWGLRDPLADEPTYPGLEAFSIEASWEPYLALDPAIVQRRAVAVLAAPAGINLEFEERTMIVSGDAPHAWVERVSKNLYIPGIQRIDTSGVRDMDEVRLKSLLGEVEGTVLVFQANSAALDEDRLEAIETLKSRLQDVETLTGLLDMTCSFDIYGSTDSTGSKELNRELKQARAKTIFELLESPNLTRVQLRIGTNDVGASNTRGVWFRVVCE